jgi:hypothetical protein
MSLDMWETQDQNRAPPPENGTARPGIARRWWWGRGSGSLIAACGRWTGGELHHVGKPWAFLKTHHITKYPTSCFRPREKKVSVHVEVVWCCPPGRSLPRTWTPLAPLLKANYNGVELGDSKYNVDDFSFPVPQEKKSSQSSPPPSPR